MNFSGLFAKESRSRRLSIAALLWLAVTVVYFASAPRDLITSHSRFNHFALLADAWLHGRLDLGGPPPAYAAGNDFAHFDGRWFVVFPAFPALLLLPFVKLAGSPEGVQDGQFFLWLAGLAPALLFLCFERLRREQHSALDETKTLLLACCFAFGSVYYFSALQGSVWFAAHVVAAVLTAAYLLCALSAARPLLSGIFLACAFATRTPLIFAALLFVLEAARQSAVFRPAAPQTPNWRGFARDMSRFVVPILIVLALTAWHNYARFGDAREVGYRYLSIAWQTRIEKWGLFSYHYLGRNLAVIFTSLPWLPARSSAFAAPFQINLHGLALWITTPLYLWLVRSRLPAGLVRNLALSALVVAVPTLFYQNSGWLQFGYRFSNDYAPFLFLWLACILPRRWSAAVYLAAGVALAVNLFGALTFQRAGFEKYYYFESTQQVLHQPD